MLQEGKVLLGGDGAADQLAEQAPVFAPLLDRFGPPRVDAGSEPFPALVEAICNQQLSVQAGASVLANVQALCSGQIRAADILDASTEELRGAGLSGPKVGYVQALAQRVTEGDLPLDRLDEMDDAAVVDALTEVKGIGRWTAQMVLIFTLHRPDVLPTGDLGVRDGARIVLDLDAEPTEDALMELAEPWRPYRSLASWYLWRERDRRLREQGKR